MFGLGVTFDRPEPNDLQGRLISVSLSGDHGAVHVRVEGEIKNVATPVDGDLRVGVEFVRLSEAEQAITGVLTAMSAALVAN